MGTFLDVIQTYHDNKYEFYTFNLLYHDKDGNKLLVTFTRKGQHLILLGTDSAIAMELFTAKIKPDSEYVDDALTWLCNYSNVTYQYNKATKCYMVFGECDIPIQ